MDSIQFRRFSEGLGRSLPQGVAAERWNEYMQYRDEEDQAEDDTTEMERQEPPRIRRIKP
ncbi:hypothetical protein [Paenibacillus mucilaginosus]|uniref:Uncharacterized protein n=3 Tax=Paenibacillus mucilaginosus TaxID=61624 RepID=H6NH59_9BACL|nr:hypothetical protein [Paenibacillus mucilaginosus]AEI40085.1 hypothetical protein KNP414_01521 [Paenibacillus mucilaginosus KNP414]AFC28737.1 hypothetical protein PM3016_1829 [Paenibacillus mucilaginosus 3016]AFH60915.1 hypothetical protein B2K_09305 [Paenibacillus mucilaginosus K02]MCG7215691.1 hypothetical protein [Paenibacillus mucilaginosus]WDM29323.1 hypothetical protein KCX80_09265 [Paenibacillus mucilaginosus]